MKASLKSRFRPPSNALRQCVPNPVVQLEPHRRYILMFQHMRLNYAMGMISFICDMDPPATRSWCMDR